MNIFAILTAALPACQYEDSSGCHWNAEQGNGAGTSFVSLSDARLYRVDGGTIIKTETGESFFLAD